MKVAGVFLICTTHVFRGVLTFLLEIISLKAKKKFFWFYKGVAAFDKLKKRPAFNVVLMKRQKSSKR